MKIGEREWEVDYEFHNNKANRIKTGFKTEAEAKAWAEKNTTDGKVQWYERVW